jgi:hypothetical protein
MNSTDYKQTELPNGPKSSERLTTNEQIEKTNKMSFGEFIAIAQSGTYFNDKESTYKKRRY